VAKEVIDALDPIGNIAVYGDRVKVGIKQVAGEYYLVLLENRYSVSAAMALTVMCRKE
jgi:hypothetical protein